MKIATIFMILLLPFVCSAQDFVNRPTENFAVFDSTDVTLQFDRGNDVDAVFLLLNITLIYDDNDVEIIDIKQARVIADGYWVNANVKIKQMPKPKVIKRVIIRDHICIRNIGVYKS